MADADPCSLVWPPLLKRACQNTYSIASGRKYNFPDGSSPGTLVPADPSTPSAPSKSGLPSLLNPLDWSVGFGGDIAHFMIRVAEGIIGLILIVVGAAGLTHTSPSKLVKGALK